MRRNKWIKSEGNGGAEIFKWKLKYPIQILFFFLFIWMYQMLRTVVSMGLDDTEKE